MDIEQELAAAEAERDAIRAQQQELRVSEDLVLARIETLRRHLDGGDRPPPASRTDRVLEALRRTGGLSPSQLTAHLRVDEPDVDPRAVRATLNHLRQHGKVERPQRGLWVASP